MSRKPTSIQTRLTLLVLGVVFLFGLLAGYVSYRSALHEVDEIFDAQLAQFAQNLMVVVKRGGGDDEQADSPMPAPAHHYQQTLAFQVWTTDPHSPLLLLRSDNVSRMTFAQIPDEGYSASQWQGEHWRYYRQRDEQRGLDVLVGQSDKARNEMAQIVALNNIAPFLLGLPLLALYAIMAIRVGLRPLLNLTASLRQLSPEQLEPVAMHDAPREIAPVVDALNHLLDRIARVMENERRFTADASHELRTPLAAIQSQIQAAQLSDSESERAECHAKALLGAERMTHLVEQLLTLSRLDEVSFPLNQETVNLLAITEECCAEAGMGALHKNIEIGLSSDANPTIPGSAEMLRILLRNLLDNAIRYTPQDGRVDVSLRLINRRLAELEIADSGTGVPDEQLALLGQRFNRLSPHAADGVGLGLSIVQRVAEIHHARISFSRAALGGLSVKVSFPLI